MSGHGSFVKSAGKLLVFFFIGHCLLLLFRRSSIRSRHGAEARDKRRAVTGCEIPLTRYSTLSASGNAALIALYASSVTNISPVAAFPCSREAMLILSPTIV